MTSLSLEDRRERYACAIKLNEERAASIGERLKQQTAVKVAMEKYKVLSLEMISHMDAMRRDAEARLRQEASAESETGPIQDVRGWVECRAISEFTYREIMESIIRRCKGDAELQQFDDIVTEAKLYMLRHPEPNVMMTKAELSAWIYNYLLAGAFFLLVSSKVNEIYSRAAEMDRHVDTVIHDLRVKDKYAKRAADYYDHYYNPRDLDGFSRWTCKITPPIVSNQHERNSPSLISNCVALHHVRVARGTTKVFLHVLVHYRYPSLVGWFALCDPSQTDQLLHSICMPTHSILAHARWVNPPSTSPSGEILERDNTLDGSQVQIQFTLARGTISFLFEGCTLDKTGPLPDCLRRFIPRNYRVNQSNPYVFETPLNSRFMYLYAAETNALYINPSFCENSDGVY